MDLIQIDENGLHLVFEKTEDFGCKLLHFSALPFDERSLLQVHDRETGGLRLNTERYNLLEIMISGQNRPGERHGNKYISTSPGDRMKLVYFADKHNEFGASWKSTWKIRSAVLKRFRTCSFITAFRLYAAGRT